ncbi:MAG: transporter substrate-binding domain-containing protein [Proteobacteria bacterium]|nr:transporter substrate-binding domain-containing protein [Pseudomonadota bacterium]
MRKGIMVGVLAFLSIAAVCMAENKVITAAADPYPPFVDQSDPQEGLSLAIIRAAYKTQGYTVTMEFVPWARAKSLTIEGKYDILPDCWINEENKKTMLFSDPYAVNVVKFIKRADDPFEYAGMESLKGKKIGAIRGYNYSDDFKEPKDFTREDVTDLMTNIKKVIGGRVDLTLEDEIVAKVQIAKNDPALLSQIKFGEKAFDSKSLYVSAGLANPRHQEIIGAFNKGLAEIKANGEFAKIMAGYGIKDMK